MAIFDALRRRSDEEKVPEYTADEQHATISAGSFDFAVESGGNTDKTTYQEANGAPVESKSPLGYQVGWVTVVFLNLSKMVGTGIFSTPASVLAGVGSVGLALFYWFIGFLISAATLSIYIEFASYFPSRSGSEVVYLEQAYPRPKYFFPTIFAVQTVIFSFSASNAIVLANYLYKLAGSTPIAWELKGVAVAGYTVAVLLLVFNTRWSLRLSNFIGLVKLITLIFIGITGLVVLGGGTRVKDPKANFRNAFEGTSDATAYGATNAMYKIIFSYAGYENAFNVVNEVRNPTKTLRWSAPLSLLVVSILYMLANIAYFAAATKEEILSSKLTAASVFFANVFANKAASRALNFLICCSAFGNLIAVLIGQSRMMRECGRQGVLPWTKFWTSTKPFGTPLGPYFVKWALTMVMILAPPAGDAFNFVVDLAIDPSNIFLLTLSTGLLVLRWRRKKAGLPASDFRTWYVAIGFSILANVYLIVAPWYPPSKGANGGDVSFWYATYVVTGIGLLVLCGVYYYVWIVLLPKLKNYSVRQTIVDLGDGAITHRLVKVPNAEVAKWDAEHDAVGRVVQRSGYAGSEEEQTYADAKQY